jgi:hypothetical protein
MWIDGGIHAREWITPAVVTFMIRQLVENQESEEADLLDNLDWYILPVVNPGDNVIKLFFSVNDALGQIS